MKPFLKWAGGKYRIIDRICKELAPGKRLIEPFVGSGAVFLNTDYDNYLLCDINKDLINLYLTLQQEGPQFIEYCSAFFTAENNNENRYYELRGSFNRTSDKREKAALFLYLNKHGYNGLCRYNASGEFNSPFGRYIKPYFPANEMMNFWKKSQRAEFLCCDFRDAMAQAVLGDVIYCDPPYVPLNATANFTEYSAGGFAIDDQRDLARLAQQLSEKGIPVLMSNHDTEFIRREYATAKLITFDVQRFISCDGQNRGKASEVLALFGGR
ncbi:MAG: Dam family site-specific DNA-(adenine-N6)-methyltransferase [Peptococcaceae bacterium]|nr:Dam family site-specific DNA-(adenine-N6)-methyltransferase [Peptococcaceae bacterium]